MAINLSDNIQTNAPKPSDSRYLNNLVPYISITEVNSTILSGNRYIGLTVNINGSEYWYKDGIGDNDLIEKTSGGGSGMLNWTGSTSNAIGTYISVSGICAQPNLTFNGSILNVTGKVVTDTLQVETGAAAGCVLVSDGNGNATWQTPSGGATNLDYTTAVSSGTVSSSTGTNATIPAATTSLAGLMACADKVKLDGIAAGAQVNVATNLSTTHNLTNVIINSSTGTNATIDAATASGAGIVTNTTQTFGGAKTTSIFCGTTCVRSAYVYSTGEVSGDCGLVTGNFAIKHNVTTDSLDFNYIG